MASPSTNCSSGSSEGDSRPAVIDPRKRKRMESNRESARKSRMRKQKHLDELNSQVAQLRKENTEIVTGINIATQHYLALEADNSILRAQMMELSHRLQSLNEMINYICCSTAAAAATSADASVFDPICNIGSEHGYMNFDPMGPDYMSHPIMAVPAEAMLQY